MALVWMRPSRIWSVCLPEIERRGEEKQRKRGAEKERLNSKKSIREQQHVWTQTQTKLVRLCVCERVEQSKAMVTAVLTFVSMSYVFVFSSCFAWTSCICSEIGWKIDESVRLASHLIHQNYMALQTHLHDKWRTTKRTRNDNKNTVWAKELRKMFVYTRGEKETRCAVCWTEVCITKQTNTQSIHISSGPVVKSEKSETMIRNTSQKYYTKSISRARKKEKKVTAAVTTTKYNQIKKNTKHLKCFFLLCRFLRKKNKHTQTHTHITHRITRILTWILILNDLISYPFARTSMRCNTCARFIVVPKLFRFFCCCCCCLCFIFSYIFHASIAATHTRAKLEEKNISQEIV